MIGFLTPWLLLGLIALPILWWLLRAVPPAPLVRRFPAVSLLIGLEDRETTPDRTPWWLLVLRMLALAAAIVGFAEPVLNPSDRVVGKGPLLVAMDASWASAQSWGRRQDKLTEVLQLAQADGRAVAVVKLSEMPRGDAPVAFGSGSDWLARVEGLEPAAWEPDYAPWIAAVEGAEPFETVWISDRLARDGRAEMMAAFAAKGAVQVAQDDTPVLALRGVGLADGALITTALRLGGTEIQGFGVAADGPDPAGVNRVLARADGQFEEGAEAAEIRLEAPSELRNRIKRLSLDAVRSAGGVVVTDDTIQRRKVALIGGARENEGAVLVSPLHFLRKALVPTAEVIEADLSDALLASPDVLILADVAAFGEQESLAVQAWVEGGGLLLRFAGPRLAGSGIGQKEEHPLLPVRLRAGGRDVGGAMSWGSPKALREFSESSPFYGLRLPDDVLVKSQVMAQPDPNLSARVMASLADGTPLVTGKDLGQGRVVLVHVTANADWSNLPLSGLFVQMLERLAISARTGALDAADVADVTWVPEQVLDGFGVLREAPTLAGVDGALLAAGKIGPDMPPGIYASAERRVAINAVAADRVLAAASWPVGTDIVVLSRGEEQPLMAWLLMAALGFLMADILATLWIGGRLSRRFGAAAVGLLLALMPLGHGGAQAQTNGDIGDILAATNNTVLAYVITGDRQLDDTSQAGLRGLSAELFRRTSIEPISPVGVDLRTAELAVYPFLYWPVTDTQTAPKGEVVAKLNTYLRGGGMILFDTRDANIGRGLSNGTPNGRVLQQIALQLDVPPLQPIPEDHVLTRAFYLLQDFPGRYANAPVWVEAAPANAQKVEGMPFRNLNDGVSPVVIGGNDWASAWAINENGRHLFPVGRGVSGERQREIAIRFGVNLIMHVLTGNYKSDQVHVPALLDRLGQ